MDRPLGSAHPLDPDSVYPVNYGHIEGKLVVAPKGVDYSDEEILKEVAFQEQYFESVLLR